MKFGRRSALTAGVALPLGVLAASRACRNAPGASVPGTSSPVVARVSVRPIERVISAERTSDGAGVKLNRVLGGRALNLLDPFLLLDEFKTEDPNDYLAGFPDHPHRGFETVTYMIHGAMEHRDSVGNRGRLGPKSAQWMTAGHGIVHSEMPKQERGLMWGFQLWVNLPAASKMRKPRYQDIVPDAIPEVETDTGARVRIIAGVALGTEGPVRGIDVEPIFLDVALTKGSTFRHALPPGHTAFAYVTDGAARIGTEGQEVRRRELAVLGGGDEVAMTCDSDGGRVLLLAGRPLKEPVARYGPFVMNTEEEIRQAIADYKSGRLTDG